MKVTSRILSFKMALVGLCTIAILGLPRGIILAQDPKPLAQTEETNPDNLHGHGSLSDVGAKLANPLSSLWALSFSFETPKFFDGDINTGDPRAGADMVFQPVLPFPLYGTGDEQWRLITRPVVPFIFSQPVPTGFDEFDNKAGIGDIQLPLILSFPDKKVGN